MKRAKPVRPGYNAVSMDQVSELSAAHGVHPTVIAHYKL